MKLRLIVVALAMLAMASSAFAAEEYVIKNAGITRVVSRFGGPLRTNKLEANGVSLLKQPGVDIQIDLDCKGEPVSLVPSDFEVKGAETIKNGHELVTSLRLQCHHDGLPLTAYIRYYRDPLGSYQQKSILIPPFKGAPGAVIRRVVIEDLVLSPEFEPVSPVEPYSIDAEGKLTASASEANTRFTYGSYSSHAAFDQKSKTGLFFFVTSPVGREFYVKGRGLTMWENVYVPLEKGHETGRATIGTANGSPEIVFKDLREFLWKNSCLMHGKQAAPADAAVTAAHKADVAGVTGILALDLDEWKLTKAISPGWIKQADFEAVGEFTSACEKLRKANPGALIRLVAPGPSRPDLLHWLGIVDQVAWTVDGVADPLTLRQLRYRDAFIYPLLTLGPTEYALGRLAPFAGVYQHMLNAPDGKNIEGEGHIIDNKGFLVFRNPSGEARKIAIPLDEPELQLKGTLTLTDWTNPDSVTDLGAAHVGDKVEIDLLPGSTRVIGVNLPKSP